MTVRTATTDDCEEIVGIAERSFQASYSLSPEQIETIIEEEFTVDSLASRIEDENVIVTIAEDEENVLGFAEADVETGMIRWLHVDPTMRGDDVGTALIERHIEDSSAHTEPLTVRVLEEATEGGNFLEQFGLNRSDTEMADFGDESLSAHLYTKTAQKVEANEPAVEVPESVSIEGEERPVDEEQIPGTESPFFQTYTGPDRSERYGFFCSSCGSTDVSADDLDRLECSNCGNNHLAEEWDDAYL